MHISSVLRVAALTITPMILPAWLAASCSAGSADRPFESQTGGGGGAGNGSGTDAAAETSPGAGSGDNGGAAGNDAAGGIGANGGSDSNGGYGSDTQGGAGGSIPVPPDAEPDSDNSCVGQKFPGSMPPLDVYILLDATASMKGSEDSPEVWSHVVKAISDLVAIPETEGMGVGLTYLPVPPPPGFVIPGSCKLSGSPGCPPAQKCEAPLGPGTGPLIGFACTQSCSKNEDCGFYGPCMPFALTPLGAKKYCEGIISPSVSCDPADYGVPVVPIAALPGNKAAIVDAISKKKADGEATPTQPALEGAIAFAKDHAKKNPDHLVHVLFATDGIPNNCTYNNIKGAAAAAEKAFNDYPSIPTFVLGIGKLSDLDAIAKAGGTKQTYLADGSTVASQLVDVFNEIRANGECQFVIPQPGPGLDLDFDAVNVWYTPLASSEKEAVPYVDDVESCDPELGGWYYDDPTKKSPTKVLLCPKTCEGVKLSAEGVEVQLGCKTIGIIH